MSYRIGCLNDPRDDDPTFADWQSALEAAVTMSGEDTWVIAIWTADGGIEALVYETGVYT